MRNLLRFLAFIIIAACAVGILYFWRTTSPAVSAAVPHGSPANSVLATIDQEFTSLVGNVLPSVVSINAIPANMVGPDANVLRSLLGAGPGVPPPSQLGSDEVGTG
ncbi:MAG: hypothetical protein ACOYM3_04990 [Terrimicrobiaceae bacterium]